MNCQVLTLYVFCRLALGDGVLDVSSYSRNYNVTSYCAGPESSQAEMAEELRQTKELRQQLLQRNHVVEYTMMQVIISTFVVW
jgi:hypothetical protein